MDRLALLGAALIPAFAILAWAVTKARADWRNEALWTGFLLGAVAALAVAGVAGLLSLVAWGQAWAEGGLAGAALGAVLKAALPEESVKFAVLVWVVERHVDVRRKQDLLPMAVAVSLGFAALENLFYLDGASDWRGVAAVRALTAVPAHGVDGVLMGALLILARLNPRRRLSLVMALAVPVAVHAAYDFPIFAWTGLVPGPWAVLWLLVLAVSGVWAMALSCRALGRAAVADAGAGAPLRAFVMVPLAVAIMAGGMVVCAGLVLAEELPWLALPLAVPVGILPLAFGGDLLWWGWRQRRPGAP